MSKVPLKPTCTWRRIGSVVKKHSYKTAKNSAMFLNNNDVVVNQHIYIDECIILYSFHFLHLVSFEGWCECWKLDVRSTWYFIVLITHSIKCDKIRFTSSKCWLTKCYAIYEVAKLSVLLCSGKIRTDRSGAVKRQGEVSKELFLGSQDTASATSCRTLHNHNSPADWARELFIPSKHAEVL